MDYLSESQQSIKKTSHTYMKVGKVTPIFFSPPIPGGCIFCPVDSVIKFTKKFHAYLSHQPTSPISAEDSALDF